MLSVLKRLWRNESGQDLVEYVLVVAVVGLALGAGTQIFGNSIGRSAAASANTLNAVAAGQQGGGGGQQGDGGGQQGGGGGQQGGGGGQQGGGGGQQGRGH